MSKDKLVKPSGGTLAEGIGDKGQKPAGSEASLVPLIREQFAFRKVFRFVCGLPYKNEQVSQYTLHVE